MFSMSRLASVFVLAVSLLVNQTSVAAQSQLVRRYENGCGNSCAQELAIDIGKATRAPDDRLAVRLCSRKPLAAALVTATAPPDYVLTILKGSYGYTEDRIWFLVSPDCETKTNAATTTEFWVVPKAAQLPSATQTVVSTQVHVDQLGAPIGDAASYGKLSSNLIQKLRANPGAVGVVVGYYYQKPSPLLRRRLRAIDNSLRQSGLSKDRYFTHLMRWPGEYAASDPEPTYPSGVIIELNAKPR